MVHFAVTITGRNSDRTAIDVNLFFVTLSYKHNQLQKLIPIS